MVVELPLSWVWALSYMKHYLKQARYGYKCGWSFADHMSPQKWEVDVLPVDVTVQLKAETILYVMRLNEPIIKAPRISVVSPARQDAEVLSIDPQQKND